MKISVGSSIKNERRCFMVSRRSFMTSAVGIAAGVLTQGARALTDLQNPLPIFPNKDAKWKRSWDQATATLTGNTRTLGTYPHPVLIEGPGYPGVWMECGPTEALRKSAVEAVSSRAAKGDG